MSTNDVKEALLIVYPSSSSKDWKRRSKTKTSDGVERIFENTATGDKATTVGTLHGIMINGEFVGGVVDVSIIDINSLKEMVN